MKFLMDTDHITILQRPSGEEFVRLQRRIQTEWTEDFVFSVVSFHEQVMGCNSYISQAQQLADMVKGDSMLDRILMSDSLSPVLSFDMNAASKFEELSAQRLRVATMDLRIAAITISNGLILLTRNIRDFGKVPGLLTQDWTA